MNSCISFSIALSKSSTFLRAHRQFKGASRTVRLLNSARQMTTSFTMPNRRLQRPALFLCDLQEKFRPAIWEFEKIVSTASKMMQASRVLNVPIYATTQNRKGLGPTVPELELSELAADIDKSLFSMCVPELLTALPTRSEVIIMGIEAHICVTQTTLDLLEAGHRVYVLADGVSSCNKEEVPLALRRLSKEGAVITTSESMIYEIMGDASIPEFKQVVGLIKQHKDSTSEVLQRLCKF